MLPIILAVIISQSSSDTILVKGTRGLAYRAFIIQDTLYLQYKTEIQWSEPIVIDNEGVDSPSMAISSGGYLHIVWCKQGKVYYRTSIEPITLSSIKRNLKPQWSWKMAISTVYPFTEPASNPIVQLYDDKIFVTWQGPNESNDSIGEKWERWKYVCPDALWEISPLNKSEIQRNGCNCSVSSPNPFRRSGLIRYQLAQKSRVNLQIYDILGRSVRTLENSMKDPGIYEVRWDGKDNRNRTLSHGIYFIRLKTDDYTEVKKAVLVK